MNDLDSEKILFENGSTMAVDEVPAGEEMRGLDQEFIDCMKNKFHGVIQPEM